jgi:hypothetical protein
LQYRGVTYTFANLKHESIIFDEIVNQGLRVVDWREKTGCRHFLEIVSLKHYIIWSD